MAYDQRGPPRGPPPQQYYDQRPPPSRGQRGPPPRQHYQDGYDAQPYADEDYGGRGGGYGPRGGPDYGDHYGGGDDRRGDPGYHGGRDPNYQQRRPPPGQRGPGPQDGRRGPPSRPPQQRGPPPQGFPPRGPSRAAGEGRMNGGDGYGPDAPQGRPPPGRIGPPDGYNRGPPPNDRRGPSRADDYGYDNRSPPHRGPPQEYGEPPRPPRDASYANSPTRQDFRAPSRQAGGRDPYSPPANDPHRLERSHTFPSNEHGMNSDGHGMTNAMGAMDINGGPVGDAPRPGTSAGIRTQGNSSYGRNSFQQQPPQHEETFGNETPPVVQAPEPLPIAQQPEIASPIPQATPTNNLPPGIARSLAFHQGTIGAKPAAGLPNGIARSLAFHQGQPQQQQPRVNSPQGAASSNQAYQMQSTSPPPQQPLPQPPQHQQQHQQQSQQPQQALQQQRDPGFEGGVPQGYVDPIEQRAGTTPAYQPQLAYEPIERASTSHGERRPIPNDMGGPNFDAPQKPYGMPARSMTPQPRSAPGEAPSRFGFGDPRPQAEPRQQFESHPQFDTRQPNNFHQPMDVHQQHEIQYDQQAYDQQPYHTSPPRQPQRNNTMPDYSSTQPYAQQNGSQSAHPYQDPQQRMPQRSNTMPTYEAAPHDQYQYEQQYQQAPPHNPAQRGPPMNNINNYNQAPPHPQLGDPRNLRLNTAVSNQQTGPMNPAAAAAPAPEAPATPSTPTGPPKPQKPPNVTAEQWQLMLRSMWRDDPKAFEPKPADPDAPPVPPPPPAAQQQPAKPMGGQRPGRPVANNPPQIATVNFNAPPPQIATANFNAPPAPIATANFNAPPPQPWDNGPGAPRSASAGPQSPATQSPATRQFHRPGAPPMTRNEPPVHTPGPAPAPPNAMLEQQPPQQPPQPNPGGWSFRPVASPAPAPAPAAGGWSFRPNAAQQQQQQQQPPPQPPQPPQQPQSYPQQPPQHQQSYQQPPQQHYPQQQQPQFGYNQGPPQPIQPYQPPYADGYGQAPVTPQSTNPDALPAHPAPVRPGLMQQNQAMSPVQRQYQGGPPPPQQGQPAQQRRPDRRLSVPVSIEEINRLKAEIQANPNDNATQLFLAKRLVDASVSLIDEGGRADTRTKNKNRENYIFEAHRMVKKLIAANYPDAMFFLADCYGTGQLGLAVDAKEAFSYYQQAAKLGHAPSAYRTAMCCEIGHEAGGGTKKDPLKAVQWYRRAAALGDVSAMYKLGMILLKGLLGQPASLGEAQIWLKRAAERADSDNPHAVHELAQLHELAPNGGKIIRDEAYAFQLYDQAARLGYARSQYRLGKAFEHGQLGCGVDNRSSIHWYSKAAAQEDHDAELALSGWYLTGSEGILNQSDQEAYLWARKAALAELPKAEFAMGYYSEVGIGCPRSLEDAKRWYGRAASHRYPKALERLEELRRGGPKAQKNRERMSRGNAAGRGSDECVVM